MGIDSRKTARPSRRALTLAGAILALGCGGSGAEAGFPSTDRGAGALADGGGDASSDDASTPFPDSGQFMTDFTGGDGGFPPVTFECKPGTYSGTFTTTVTTDAGLFSSLFSFNWTGTLSITLVGHVTQNANGESFAAPVLTIAPGANLSGADNFGGHFSSGLSGQLDCPNKKLTGTLSNGMYEYPGDAGSITMEGNLSGAYDGSTTPPALTMGEIGVSSPTYPTLAAAGGWSATLQ
jgi:hypothetical protein